jgi:hypothetical protein
VQSRIPNDVLSFGAISTSLGQFLGAFISGGCCCRYVLA